MFELKSSFVRLSLFAAAAMLAALPALSQQPPPQCEPPAPPPDNSIPYRGLISGCSSQPGGNPICLVGEPIQFQLQNGMRECNTSYLWQFENGPLDGFPTMIHQFPSAGTFLVKLTLIQGPTGNPQFQQLITIVDPQPAPTLGTFAMVLLVASCVVIALRTM